MKANIPSACITLLMLLVCQITSGQISDSLPHKKLIHQVEFDVAPNFVFQTKDFLKGKNRKGEKIDQSLSLQAKYAFRFAPDSYLGRLYPYAYQGIGVAYNTFYNSREMGNPIAVYAFQGSRIASLAQHLSLNYEWNFGASFGWKPYDENKNWANDMVGSKINAYMNLGLYLNWQMNPSWQLSAGLGLTHYSNGNTHYPNSGINLIGTRIGITRVFDANYHTNEKTASKPLFISHWTYDVVLYGATRSKGIVEESYLVPGSFGVAGFNFNPMYNFSPYFRAGMSLDGQYDESANIENHVAGRDEKGGLKFYRPPFRESVAVGLSMRTELVMPIFSINFGIGHNVLYKGESLKGFYQILALKTYVTPRLYLHVGYQLNKFHDPKNLMLGFGYRFH